MTLYQIEIKHDGEWEPFGLPDTYRRAEARATRLAKAYLNSEFRVVVLADDPGADEYPAQHRPKGGAQ